MPEPNSNQVFIEEEVIDLREYLKILQKWRKVIAIGTLFCVLTAGILSFFVLPPVYEAQTLLMVSQATSQLQSNYQNRSGDLEDVMSEMSRRPVLTMNTYLGQLKSEVLMKTVIKELKLDPNLYTPLSLSKMLTATVVKDSNLIEVKVQNNDPVLASRIANTLSKEYLHLISQKNDEQMSRSVSFFQQQRTVTEKELQEAVKALEKFQAEPRGVAVLEQEFTKKAENQAALQSRLTLAQIEVSQLNAGVNLLEQELASTSGTIQVEKFDPQSQKVVTAQDINPVYVSIAQQLNDKKATMAERHAEIDSLYGNIESYRYELDMLQAELSGKRLEQDRLVREVERLKETELTLARKATETQITKSIDLGDTTVMVMSEASVPDQPIKPNKKLNMAVALVLGLMVFTALSFVLEHLDNTIKNPEDVASQLELPVMGLIPMINTKTTKHSYGG